MKVDTNVNNEKEFVIAIGGRLDANTAKDLNNILSKTLDNGYTNVLIDCANLKEISSAGLDFLLKNHNKFNEFNGSLVLKNTSYELEKILNKENASSIIYGKTSSHSVVVDKHNKFIKDDNTIYKYYKALYHTPNTTLEAFGNPDKFEFQEFAPTDPFLLQYSPSTIGLGLGSLSYDIKTSHDSFGEFLNIGNYTFHMPPKDNCYPDYQKVNNINENSIYKIHTLYALRAYNDFCNVINFSNEDNNSLNLSDLLKVLMNQTKSKAISFVICGKIKNFCGVKLTKAILASKNNNIFSINNFNNNFKIITQDDYHNHIAILVGFAINNTNKIISKFLKPYYGSNPSLFTHIHSLIFNYQPLKFSYKDSVNDLIEAFMRDNKALDLCHIINDPINNNETSFVDGICYFNSLNEFKTGEFK